MGPSALDRENGAAQELCARPSRQPRSTLRASAVAVPRNHRSPRASDASRWRMGLPALAGCGRLQRLAGLRRSAQQPSMEAGRSDLCSRHQRGSTGHPSCCVIRVTQLCRISQVCRKLARDARPAALATTHTPSDLSLVVVSSTQRVLGHATWARPCRIARKWSQNAPFLTAGANGAVLGCSFVNVCLQAMC